MKKSTFLVRYPDPPMPISEKEGLTIGRAEINNINLIEPRVSRFHAKIEYRETLKRCVLIDLGSSNGTTLNAEKLISSREYPLEDWDKIRIASAVFTVRFVKDHATVLQDFVSKANDVYNGRTQVMSIATLQGEKESTPAISGNLNHLCPIDIFQMLEQTRKTGTVHIRTENGGGVYDILQGNITSATFGNLTGEQAVFAILTATNGSFQFNPHSGSNITIQITKPTTFLLMEGCRILDETPPT